MMPPVVILILWLAAISWGVAVGVSEGVEAGGGVSVEFMLVLFNVGEGVEVEAEVLL